MQNIAKKMKEKSTADSDQNFPPPLNDLNSYYTQPQNYQPNRNSKTNTHPTKKKKSQLTLDILEKIEKSKGNKMNKKENERIKKNCDEGLKDYDL